MAEPRYKYKCNTCGHIHYSYWLFDHCTNEACVSKDIQITDLRKEKEHETRVSTRAGLVLRAK